MGRSLSSMTWKVAQQEMSIAGNPAKITQFGEEVLDLAKKTIDLKNIPEIENGIFALQKIISELKLYARWEREAQRVQK